MRISKYFGFVKVKRERQSFGGIFSSIFLIWHFYLSRLGRKTAITWKRPFFSCTRPWGFASKFYQPRSWAPLSRTLQPRSACTAPHVPPRTASPALRRRPIDQRPARRMPAELHPSCRLARRWQRRPPSLDESSRALPVRPVAPIRQTV